MNGPILDPLSQYWLPCRHPDETDSEFRARLQAQPPVRARFRHPVVGTAPCINCHGAQMYDLNTGEDVPCELCDGASFGPSEDMILRDEPLYPRG